MIRKAFELKAKKFLAMQSLFYAVANSIEAMVPFLLAPILTRTLDPTAYGIWVLFITYATFLRPIVGLTSQDAIRMRFYDFDKKQLDQPAANNCSGFVPSPFAPGGVSFTSRRPSDARDFPPSRPPVVCVFAVYNTCSI